MTANESLAKLIRTALSNGETVRVSFLKVDGTLAVDRQITRNLIVIPKDKHPKFVRGENPDYITGFDIKKNDWIRFTQGQCARLHGIQPSRRKHDFRVSNS
jgi:hypothetical protein